MGSDGNTDPAMTSCALENQAIQTRIKWVQSQSLIDDVRKTAHEAEVKWMKARSDLEEAVAIGCEAEEKKKAAEEDLRGCNCEHCKNKLHTDTDTDTDTDSHDAKRARNA